MTTIAEIITPTLTIMKRRTPTQSRRQQQQKQQSNKNGNSNDGDVKVAIITSTKIVFVNQVLITIRTNPVVRIMRNVISDTFFNVQSPWRYCLLNTSPIVFSLQRD